MKPTAIFLFIHLLLSLLLFNLFEQKKGVVNKERSVLYSNSKEHRIITNTKDWKYSLLIIAYVTGERRNLPSSLKKLHQKFYLGHLFTPSALHFSALLLLLTPLLNILVRKKSYRKVALLVIYITAFTLLPTLHSIHRVALYKILQTFNLKKIHRYYIFLVTFSVDFLWGNFLNSPKSFLYSFLFFGAIATLTKIKASNIFLVILVSQLFLSGYFHSEFYPLPFLIGFLYTSLFSLLFPIYLIFYLFPFDLFTPLIKIIFSLLSLIFRLFPDSSFSLNISMLCVFTFYIFMFFRGRAQRILLLLILMLFTPSLLNFPSLKFLKNIQTKNRPSKILKIERVTKGYKTNHSQKVCYHTLYNASFKVFCRKI